MEALMRLAEANRDLVRALIERLSREPTEVLIATLLVVYTILRFKLKFSTSQIAEGLNKGDQMVAFLYQEHEKDEAVRRKKEYWAPPTFH